MTKAIYPLAQVVEVKQKRVEEAEKVLREKQKILAKEQEKLKEREAQRDSVLKHHTEKLAQIRHEMEVETTTRKIDQMKSYLKIVKEKLKIEEKKVKEQKDQVELAEKNVEMARRDLKKKQQEVDKLHLHRKDWHQAMKKELQLIEEREQDDLGNTTYELHRRRK